MVFLPSTSVFFSFNVYPLFSGELHATVCHFCSRISAGTDSDVMSFHATPAQNKKSSHVAFERDLRAIPAENLEQKVNTQQNKYQFSFRWFLWACFQLKIFGPCGSRF